MLALVTAIFSCPPQELLSEMLPCTVPPYNEMGSPPLSSSRCLLVIVGYCRSSSTCSVGSGKVAECLPNVEISRELSLVFKVTSCQNVGIRLPNILELS